MVGMKKTKHLRRNELYFCTEGATMKHVRYLLLALIARTCLAEAQPSTEISELARKNGRFEVCDIQARSDGGTTSICIPVNTGKLWLTNRLDAKQHWSAVYEDGKRPTRLISISDSDAEKLLLSWVKHRYSCVAMSDLQSGKFNASTRDDLVAATITELIQKTPACDD